MTDARIICSLNISHKWHRLPPLFAGLPLQNTSTLGHTKRTGEERLHEVHYLSPHVAGQLWQWCRIVARVVTPVLDSRTARAVIHFDEPFEHGPRNDDG